MAKPIGTEHWNVVDGVFKGLYTISAEKAKEHYGVARLWDGVDHIIKDYIKIHPEEMREQLLSNHLTKTNNFNKYGADQAMTYRHAMEIPIGLHNVLSEYHPELFTDRAKLNKLMKKYPALCACAVT
jgi:hypothetical protein